MASVLDFIALHVLRLYMQVFQNQTTQLRRVRPWPRNMHWEPCACGKSYFESAFNGYGSHLCKAYNESCQNSTRACSWSSRKMMRTLRPGVRPPGCLVFAPTLCLSSEHKSTGITLGNGGWQIVEEKRGGLKEEEAKFYCGCVLLGLQSLHKKYIVYRDLKPENLVLDSSGYCKLIDLGCAKPLMSSTDRTFTLCGTTEYLCPEMVMMTGHSLEADLWQVRTSPPPRPPLPTCTNFNSVVRTYFCLDRMF